MSLIAAGRANVRCSALASQHAAELDSLEKPVVAPFVLDTDLQSLPREEGASGVANLNYVILPSPFARGCGTRRYSRSRIVWSSRGCRQNIYDLRRDDGAVDDLLNRQLLIGD